MTTITRLNFINLAFFALVLSIYASLPNAAEILEGRVVGVHDGDTVTLLMAGNQQLKIRLAQIDAPESDQAFGQRSKQSLSDMVFNKTIKVEKETIDKYGRTVGTIFVDGLDANRDRSSVAWRGFTKNTCTINPCCKSRMKPARQKLGYGLTQTRCRLGNTGMRKDW